MVCPVQVLGLNRFIMTEAQGQEGDSPDDVPRNRRQTWAMGIAGGILHSTAAPISPLLCPTNRQTLYRTRIEKETYEFVIVSTINRISRRRHLKLHK